MEPNFSASNIDQAIGAVRVATTYIGSSKGKYSGAAADAAALERATMSLLYLAAGVPVPENESSEVAGGLPSYYAASYEMYLEYSRRFMVACDSHQLQSVRLAILDLIRVRDKILMRHAGHPETPAGYLYLMAPDPHNRWGIAICALASAFGLSVQESVAKTA